MDHMPATGQCGVDVYLGEPGKQQFFGIARPGFSEKGITEYERSVMELPKGCWQNFTLHFPLYQGVKQFWIGVNQDAQVRPPPAYADNRRIVAYGTSITQGGCASRPGMAWTNILSRNLNREIINLGFSGNGKGEPALANLMNQIKRPHSFILDYEANTHEDLKRTLPDFIQILRKKHPKIPILVMSRIKYARDYFDLESEQKRLELVRFQKQLVARLTAKGDRQISFVDGGILDFNESTVDGVHPTDLGFLQIAKRVEKSYRRLKWV